MSEQGPFSPWGDDDERGVNAELQVTRDDSVPNGDPDGDLDEAAQAWADAEAESEAELARYGTTLYSILRRSHAQSEVDGVEESLDYIDELFAESVMLTEQPTEQPTAQSIGQPTEQSIEEPSGDAAAHQALSGESSEAENQADLEDAGAVDHSAGEGAEGADGGPWTTPSKITYKLDYPDVFTWYEQWFRHAYQRRVDGRQRRWTGTWYTNLEALTRMESMWRAWEAGRQDSEVGGSLWFLNHADEHMKILMDPDGPFAHLTPEQVGKTTSAEPLAWVPPTTS